MNRTTRRKTRLRALALIACAAILSVFAAPATAHALPTHIVNGSFDYPWRSPMLGGSPDAGTDLYISTSDGRYWKTLNGQYGSFSGYSASSFAWSSNDSMYTAPGIRPIALQKIVELHKEVNGNVYAELLAENDGKAIYQDVATAPGAVYRWRLKHASIYASHTDVMSVMIGAPGHETAQQATRTSVNGGGDKVGSVGTRIATKNPAGRDGVYVDSGGYTRHNVSGIWESYQGSYLVPAGQTTTRFTFKSVDGATSTGGNFVDDISFEVAHPLRYDLNGGSGSLPDPASDNYAGYYVAGRNVALSTVKPTRTGHTFLGWSTSKVSPVTSKTAADAVSLKSSVTMASGGVTVYAVWAKNPTVTFIAGYSDATLKSQTVAFGAGATAPADPTRTGYSFTGWNGSYSNVYSDTTIPAQWRVHNYNIRFDANGGGGSMEDQQMTYDQVASLRANSFVREGYAFQGWATSRDGGGQGFTDRQNVCNLTAADNGTVTLYARWNMNRYPVTFTDGEGYILSCVSAPHGGDATAPEPPEKTGHTFIGWDKEYTNITEPVTVNAEFRPNAYRVRFDANGGAGAMSDQQMTYDEAADLDPCAFSRPGYTFQGWANEGSDAVAYADRQRVRNLTEADGGVVTLVAIWDEDPDVAVSYIAADPDRSRVSVSREELAPATGEATGSVATWDDGYKFLGWYDVATGERVSTEPELIPVRPADGLWGPATYEARIAPISYRIAFDANGGTGEMADQALGYATVAELDPCAFTREGHDFLGWATEPGGEVVFTDGQAVANLADTDGAVVTLHALWARRTHHVVFEDGVGGVLSEQDVAYGDGATAPEDPEREGYVFAGWDAPFSCVTDDLAVRAKWKPVENPAPADPEGPDAPIEPEAPDASAEPDASDEPATEPADDPAATERNDLDDEGRTATATSTSPGGFFAKTGGSNAHIWLAVSLLAAAGAAGAAYVARHRPCADKAADASDTDAEDGRAPGSE